MQIPFPQPKGLIMSNDNNTPTTEAPAEAVSAAPVAIKPPNVAVRTFRAIKNDPKTTFAVVAGVALVAGSAFLGRKTAPLHLELVESDFTPEPVIVPGVVVEDSETVSA